MLLVIACPCALVIATPVAVVSGLTAASRRGILVKGGMHLEDLGRVRGVVLDKTGTLTTGRPEVTDVLPARGTAREVLALAARTGGAQRPSDRRGGGRARGARGSRPGRPRTSARSPGVACTAAWTGARWWSAATASSTSAACAITAWTRSCEGSSRRARPRSWWAAPTTGVLGALAVTDELRPEAAEAVAELRALGLQLAVLSGTTSGPWSR